MSSPKQNKSALGHLLTVGGGGGVNSPRFVPPVLKEVGKLAAGVASVSTSGSATGNPRNKCVLKPGHSHIDWVRLSNSKDLSGLGDKAGTLEVTLEELAKHNKITDGWLAINGRVYNVTSYFPFHPGGVDELKRGLGIDATKLFFEVHNWVNCHSLLKKCHVGRLVPSQHLEPLVTRPTKDEDEPKPHEVAPPSRVQEDGVEDKEERVPPTANQPIDIKREVGEVPIVLPVESIPIHSFRITNDDPDLEISTTTHFTKPPVVSPNAMPRFDWSQKTPSIAISFTLRPFLNPLVEAWKEGKTVTVVLRYDREDKTFVNEVLFEHDIVWPGALRVMEEDGKVELSFKKVEHALWRNYGVLKQTSKTGESLARQQKTAYALFNKMELAKDVFLIELRRKSRATMYPPIGYHVRVFTGPDDEDVSRSYTPVPKPRVMFPKPFNFLQGGTDIYLVVKRYETGRMSRYICDSEVGTELYLSRPLSGGFDPIRIHDKCRFLMLAAGTGLTPMLSLMVFVLHRRIRRCRKLGLLICNKTAQSVPFLCEFNELAESMKPIFPTDEDRLYLRHVLSEPSECEPVGEYLKGPLTKEIIAGAIDAICRVKGAREEEFFVFVCGPASFNELCNRCLKELSVAEDQIHVFDG
ncbi:cytochrome b5 reductase 4 isoform X2 [Coccinella septempunctata]|uniref:cytochrome b5 reductase 4 isoform X2 n=1 Tax=Coccinella septempunctata TaxID=41139 RepID=UPI001D08C8FB|nr:cytochrome b5 reductase 4 isoform X2 [Coccinella septempunctata]